MVLELPFDLRGVRERLYTVCPAGEAWTSPRKYLRSLRGQNPFTNPFCVGRWVTGPRGRSLGASLGPFAPRDETWSRYSPGTRLGPVTLPG